MLNRFLSIGLLLVLLGCTSVSIPKYIPDENPYKRVLYVGFNPALTATRTALKDMGWKIAEETEPGIYERNRAITAQEIQQTLIFSEVRQTAAVVGSRYARINIFLRSIKDNETEVELRYLTINSTPVKGFEVYKNDAAAERILNQIEKIIDQQ